MRHVRSTTVSLSLTTLGHEGRLVFATEERGLSAHLSRRGQATARSAVKAEATCRATPILSIDYDGNLARAVRDGTPVLAPLGTTRVISCLDLTSFIVPDTPISALRAV